jgi:hypothetical protein
VLRPALSVAETPTCIEGRRRSDNTFFFFLRLNKFKECNVSSQATAWFKK